MPGETPHLHIDGAFARLTLRRPRLANRLSVDDLDVLRRHLETVNRSEVRVLVLAAEGRHFCAGFDLGAMTAIDAGARFAEVADGLAQARPITIARMQGGAYGGGSDLALACDFRIGTPACQVFVPAARIGLHFYEGGLRRFVARLGLGAAKRLMLAGQTLSAQELLGCGYLDELTEALDERVQALADEMLGMAPLALLPMKQHLNAIAEARLDAVALAADIARARDSADLREGVAALSAKRPACFEGR